MEPSIDLLAIKLYQIMHDQYKREFVEKIQVTRRQIVDAFDEATYESIRKRLKPIRQNGKGSKIYYKVSDVLKEVELSIHN